MQLNETVYSSILLKAVMLILASSKFMKKWAVTELQILIAHFLRKNANWISSEQYLSDGWPDGPVCSSGLSLLALYFFYCSSITKDAFLLSVA